MTSRARTHNSLPTNEDLSFGRHVSDIVRGCSYHTKALRHIRPLIDLPVARMVAQGVVTSRLDYFNMERIDFRLYSRCSLGLDVSVSRWSRDLFLKRLGLVS